MQTSLLLPKKIMKDLARLILSCYICKAKAIVEEVETFERIAYLTIEASIRQTHCKRLSREREREELEE